MLYRLEIENFFSIRDPQVLDLRVAKSVPDEEKRLAPIFPGSPDRVAKTVALFGANGSGKSTVLKAFAFVSWFLRDSFDHKGPGLPCERFNDEESSDRPIRLAIELGAPLDLSGAGRSIHPSSTSEGAGTFRYELHLQSKEGAIRSVSHEALRMKPMGQGKWQRVFERNRERSVLGSRTFSLSGFSQVVDKVREDASVVSTLALFEHRPSKSISGFASAVFRNILFDRIEFGDQDVVRHLSLFPDVVEALNRELQRIDLGIEEMQILQSASGPIAMFRHTGLQLPMPWSFESHGTRSFIRIFPLIFLALRIGGIAIVDEFDHSIHPLILPEIVRWFHDPARNPFDAQLWMTSHSASLLDVLTKEEIVLCEKDGGGRTRVYSLMDVGGERRARRDDNLYKKYLGGIYGAVPQVG